MNAHYKISASALVDLIRQPISIFLFL